MKPRATRPWGVEVGQGFWNLQLPWWRGCQWGSMLPHVALERELRVTSGQAIAARSLWTTTTPLWADSYLGPWGPFRTEMPVNPVTTLRKVTWTLLRWHLQWPQTPVYMRPLLLSSVWRGVMSSGPASSSSAGATIGTVGFTRKVSLEILREDFWMETRQNLM